MRFPGLLVAALVVPYFAGCAAPQPNSSPPPSPTAGVPESQTAPASAAPPEVSAHISAASPSVAPSATASATASPTVTPPTTAPPRSPNDAPEILDVSISSTDVRAGDVVSGTVRTSLNVASLEVRIANFSFGLPKSEAGRFSLSYTVPDVPFFLRGTYPMDLIARTTQGRATTRQIPITIR